MGRDRALALAFATLALAIVSWRGVRVAKQTAEDTRRMATTAEQEVHALGRQIEVQREEVGAVSAQADASAAQVEASRAALAATVQPILVDVPQGYLSRNEGSAQDTVPAPGRSYRQVSPYDISVELDEQSGPAFLVSVPTRNVGPGIAVIGGTEILSHDRSARWPGRVTLTVVPAGERTRLNFRFPFLPHDAALADERAVRISSDILGEQSGIRRFVVEVSYTDVTGEQPTRSGFEVASTQPRDSPAASWRVLRVHLFGGDAAEPFVSSDIGGGMPPL